MEKRQKSQGSGKTYERGETDIIFVISEGKVTEPNYIDILNTIKQDCHIQIAMSGNKNIKRIKREIEGIKQENGKSSEIWVAIDRNSRTESQLSEIYNMETVNVRIALSDPCFEVWLLFHYNDASAVRESGNRKSAKDQCIKALKSVEGWDDFKKKINPGLISEQHILKAIERAEKHDNPKSKKWPQKHGVTTFYRLVKSYLNRKP